MKKTFYLIATALLAVLFAGCDGKEPVGPELNEDLTFELEMDAVDGTSAKIKVSHNGTKEDTWFGFATTEDEPLDNVQELVDNLIADGSKFSLKKSTKTTYSVKDLTPGTDYTFVVVGISEQGLVYGTPNSIEFTTTKEFTGLTESQEWKISYEGRKDENETFAIDCEETSIYYFEVIEEYYIVDQNGKLYLNEYMLTIVDQLAMLLKQYSTEILLEYRYLLKGNGIFSSERIASGDYYAFAIGYNEDGTPTGTYSSTKFTIEQEEPTDAFNQWLGTYALQDANGANFDIQIESADNNFMYAISGWETGDYFNRDEDEDGDPDGVDFSEFIGTDTDGDNIPDKYEAIAFPVYFNKGNMEFYEYALTELSMSASEVAMFGLYGWGTYQGKTQLLSTLGGLIATGKTEDNGATGKIEGMTLRTDSGEDILVEAMSYAALNESHYWFFNTPIKFPITLTKKPEPEVAPASKSFKPSAPAQKTLMQNARKDNDGQPINLFNRNRFKSSMSQKSAKSFRIFDKN